MIIKEMETDSEIKGKAYVHWKSWQEAYKGIIDESYLQAFTLEKCESIAYRWKDNIIVAKDGERVVGFAGYGVNRDEGLHDAGEVFAIYILSEYYGKGVGYALMSEALTRLGEFSRVAVWVLEDNDRAIRFYQRCGFRFDGASKDISLGTTVKEVRMLLER